MIIIFTDISGKKQPRILILVVLRDGKCSGTIYSMIATKKKSGNKNVCNDIAVQLLVLRAQSTTVAKGSAL